MRNLELGESWAVKRPDNYQNNDDWDRVIKFVNSNREDNWVKYKGEADQYYGLDKRGFGFTSPYKEDFTHIVNMSEATKFILENSNIVGGPSASGHFDDDTGAIRLSGYEIGDINKI